MFAPQAQRVFDDAAAFHTPNHVFDPHTNTSNAAVHRLFVSCQFTTTWLFRGLLHHYPRDGKALKAPILVEDAMRWKAIVFLVSKAFIMPLAFIRRAEKTNMTIGGDEHKVFDGMVLFLAAIIERLVIGVTWSVYRTFRSVVEKKGRSSGSGASRGASCLAESTAVRWGRCPAAASA